jgi:hypothetical protein
VTAWNSGLSRNFFEAQALFVARGAQALAN